MRQWTGTVSALVQIMVCRLLGAKPLGTNFSEILNQNTKLFIRKNASENIICQMAAISHICSLMRFPSSSFIPNQYFEFKFTDQTTYCSKWPKGSHEASFYMESPRPDEPEYVYDVTWIYQCWSPYDKRGLMVCAHMHISVTNIVGALVHCGFCINKSIVPNNHHSSH